MGNDKSLLEADGIYCNRGEKKILQSIYIKLKEGEIVGLLGSNGAGKSTLMQIIFGSLSVEDASIRINGQKIKQGLENKIPIRYLPQFHFLPQNIAINSILKDYSIPKDLFLSEFPEYEKLLQIKIALLSSGQQRILEIFILLNASSEGFVLLDEPFTFLSPLYIEKIKQLIQKQSTNKGILLTDHLIEPLLAITHRDYFLKHGRTIVIEDKRRIMDYYCL